MFVVALIVLPGGSRTAAQTSPPTADPATQGQTAQDTPAQDSSNPDQPTTEPTVPATAVPSPPAFSANLAAAKGKVAAASETPMADSLTPVAASSVPAESASPVAIPQPTGPQDEKQKAIFDSSVNLLKLASMLKAEVDKTTADQLSVPVVRKAGEIEQLAHKMRTQ
jgi:hypothetical protein